MSCKRSLKKVIKELKKDPELRRGWEDNIAMAFQDEFNEWCEKRVGRNQAPDYIHTISNNAAKRFLNNLLRDNKH